MGIEGGQRKSIDEILRSIEPRDEERSAVIMVEGVTCEIHQTADNSWNVYVSNRPYAVDRLIDNSFQANYSGTDPLPETVLIGGKRQAIAAVEAHLTKALQD